MGFCIIKRHQNENELIFPIRKFSFNGKRRKWKKIHKFDICFRKIHFSKNNRQSSSAEFYLTSRKVKQLLLLLLLLFIFYVTNFAKAVGSLGALILQLEERQVGGTYDIVSSWHNFSMFSAKEIKERTDCFLYDVGFVDFLFCQFTDWSLKIRNSRIKNI